jgi:hypothetical protein
MAATMGSTDSVPVPADLPLGGIVGVREVRSGGAVTVRARSGTHLPGAAVAAAIRAEADR